MKILCLLPRSPLLFYNPFLFCCTQEEREKEELRLQEIMEENNRKILEAQRKLVR